MWFVKHTVVDKCWVINGEKQAVKLCETLGVNPSQILRRHNHRRHLSVRRHCADKFVLFGLCNSPLFSVLSYWVGVTAG
jgi:hypothetical protein